MPTSLGMLTLVLLVVCILASPNCNRFHKPKHKGHRINILHTSWMPSVCDRLGPKCNKSLVRNKFGIHGLWPQGNDPSDYPCCCKKPNGLDTFQFNSLSPFWKSLQRYWPSLRVNDFTKFKDCGIEMSGFESFWQHNFYRHGTCVLSNPLDHSINSSYAYFEKTISFFKDLEPQMRKNIRDLHIKTGRRNNKKSKLIAALARITDRKNFAIRCKKKTFKGVYWCLDADTWEFTSCPTGIHHKCPSEFYLPKAPPRPPKPGKRSVKSNTQTASTSSFVDDAHQL